MTNKLTLLLLLPFLIFLVVVALLLSGGLGATDIPTVSTPDGTIEFQNANTIERNGFDVRSDKHDYSGDREVVNYLMVKNESGNDLKNVIIRPQVRRNEMRILSAERLYKDVEYQYTEKVKTGQEERIREVVASSTGEIEEETYLADVYEDVLRTSTRDEWRSVSVGKTLPDKVNLEHGKNQFIVTNQFLTDLDAGEEAYFKVRLKTHSVVRKEAEPYLWEVKKGHLRTVLDPSVTSNDWDCYYSIEPDTASTTGTHANFPALYNLANKPTNIADCDFQADLDDIRFTTTTPTGGNVDILDHEIVIGTSTAGNAEVWFRHPSFDSGDTIYVLMDNPSATDVSTSSTWNSNYKGVYHMNESSGSSTDSTANNFDGSFEGNLPTQIAGQIGNAQDFDGTDDEVDINNTVTSFNNFTISSWILSASLSSDEYIEQWNGTDGNENQTAVVFRDSGSNLGIATGVSGDGFTIDGTPLQTGNFEMFHIVVNQSSSTPVMYVNADSKAVTDNTPGGSTIADLSVNNNWQIGERRTGTGGDLAGELDEVRIISTTLSSDWISTEYWQQKEQDNYWTVGTATSTAAEEEVEEVRGNVNRW